MRKITKGQEPKELTAWKRKNPKSQQYADLSSIKRQAINQATRKEQFGLCAYCCDIINEKNSMNEHVEARALTTKTRNRELDFDNIVASCITQGRCDNAHQSKPLPLTPLMAECETELRFEKSGAVEGLTPRATEAICVLGLNSKAIIEERKRMINALIYPDTLDGLQLIEDELLTDMLNDLQHPKNGQLLPYSPVLINILRQFLAPKFGN